jgi:hypothetical protein
LGVASSLEYSDEDQDQNEGDAVTLHSTANQRLARISLAERLPAATSQPTADWYAPRPLNYMLHLYHTPASAAL